MARLSLSLIILSVCLTASPVHLIVPPSTPVLSGFEPAAIGRYRELVCDASQPDAGTITYKWYKYSTDKGVEDWESKGPIGTSQKYIFNPVSEKQVFHGGNSEQVSGKYKCRASNSAGARDSGWDNLYVYTPCSLYTVSVTPAKTSVGGAFIVNCYIPNPSGMAVMWTKQTDISLTVNDVAVANNKICHTPTNARYSWSSCRPPSFSSKTNTFNLQVTNARTSDFGYWICKDIGLSCYSDPVRVVVQALPGTPQITGFPTGPLAAGTQVNLKCVALPPGDAYDWYKVNTKLTTSLTYNFLVKKESVGIYKCVARNTAGSATSSDKTLIVYSKADIVVVSSGKTSCHAGEADRFTCTATGGYPTPTLKIYIKRSGGTRVEVIQGQDMVMAKENNQAEYYCEAKVAGYPSLYMTSPRKTYNVTFPHTKVSFINNPTADIQVGQVKKLTCETDESNPVASIKWYQSVGGSWQDVTTGVASSKRNGAYKGKIRISEWSVTATKAMNGGNVRCTAEYSLTGHGFTTSADIVRSVNWSATELKMVAKPNSPITAGTSATIKCETDSSNSGSLGTISWFRNGKKITTGFTPSTRSATDGGTIYISQLTVKARKEDNQAKYECKINDQANLKKDVTITVHFPLTGLQLSEISITVKEADSKTITCRTTSSSNPAVSGVSLKKWLGSTAVDVTGTSRVTNGAYYGKDVSIDIKLDTNRKDNGAQYICSFTYGSTSFTKTATVNVQFNPSKITMIQTPTKAIHEGQPIMIVCETDSANPASDIQFHRKRTGGNWVKQSSGITSQDRNAPRHNGMIRKSTLMVTANRLDNQAVFECKVNDGTFRVDQTTTVTVYYPPAITLSLSPRTVKQGVTLDVTCEASGGNPTTFSYHWLYKQNLVPGESSKVYRIKNIQANQGGSYCCQAVNYSPGGKAEGCTRINVLFKAKWNQELPMMFTVASKPYRPIKFTLHVIANPSITGVTWVDPNTKPVKEENFIPTKVNETTYALSKSAIGFQDYGNYTARVSNSVGTSSFVFELKQAGPPLTPCCLKRVNASTVYVTLTFKSNFSGGSVQTFTIEYRKPGAVWTVGVKDIADPGFGQDVIQRVSGLEGSMIYEFRVKAVNDARTSSLYGNIMVVKTQAIPNITLTINRNGNIVTATWSPPLKRPYTRVQVKYCPMDALSTCYYHTLADPSEYHARFNVKDGTNYMFYLEVFDGPYKIFKSSPHLLPKNQRKDGWGITAFIVTSIMLLGGTVTVAVSIVMYRRSMACFSNKDKSKLQSDGRVDVNDVNGSSSLEPVYVNVNRAFNDDADQDIPPVYDNDGVSQQQVEGAIYDDIRSSQDQENVQGNSEDVDGDTRDMTENLYADLNITPDVIAAQTYAELKPWTYKRNTQA